MSLPNISKRQAANTPASPRGSVPTSSSSRLTSSSKSKPNSIMSGQPSTRSATSQNSNPQPKADPKNNAEKMRADIKKKAEQKKAEAKKKAEKKKAETKKKAEEKKKAEQKKKDDLKKLTLNELKKLRNSIGSNLKDFFKDLVDKKEKDTNKPEKNKPQGKSDNPQKNGNPQSGGKSKGGGNAGAGKGAGGGGCAKGGSGGGKGAQGGGSPDTLQRGGGKGGSTSGQEHANDEVLQKAHEEAADDCEKLGQKEEKPENSTKGVVTWKNLAECIRSNAKKGKWKDFSGGVLGTCRSDGKTCYSSKLRNNVSKLKEVIVHENIHHLEFSKLGTSDEKDTYPTHKEYSKKIKQLGGGGGGKGC